MKCCSCAIVSDHLPNDRECKSAGNCIGWYSTEHHLVFCKERMKVIKHFIPNIDEHLLPRFLDMFDIDEKYLVATSSSSIPDIINLKPITIIAKFNKKKIEALSDSETIVVVNNSMIVTGFGFIKDTIFYNSITAKNLICLARTLNIKKLKLSLDTVLQLLSPCTKEFHFQDSSCDPNISFTDIIKKAPNLERLYIYDFESNILNANSWLNDLLEYSNTKRFKRLSIKVDAIEDIEVDKFKTFVRTKCAVDVSISIHYDQTLMDTENNGKAKWEKLDQLVQKLLKYFVNFYDHDSDEAEDHPTLKIGFDGVNGYEVFSLQNALKG